MDQVYSFNPDLTKCSGAGACTGQPA